MRLLSTLLLIILPLSTFAAVAFPASDSVDSTTSGQCSAIAGVPGVPGVPGQAGSMGPHGAPGPRGDGGMPGSAGPPGGPGLAGEPGQPGEVGPPGLRAVPGKVGPMGPPGPKGPISEPGPRGLIGGPGPVGPAGNPGVKGDKGEAAVTRHSSFTVVKTVSQVGSVGELVTFNEATTNIGEDFDVAQGKYTCEIAGNYVFSFTVMVFAGSVGVALVKNGDIIVGTYTRNGNNYIDNATAMAVIQLQSGDQVWMNFTHRGRVYTEEQYKFSSLSGYLLHEI